MCTIASWKGGFNLERPGVGFPFSRSSGVPGSHRSVRAVARPLMPQGARGRRDLSVCGWTQTHSGSTRRSSRASPSRSMTRKTFAATSRRSTIDLI